MNSISIVIPAYNEEKNIPRLFQAINENIPGITDDFEVIVVDDASKDKTARILDALALTYQNVRVIHNKRNRTLGGSLKEGFKIASKDLILYFDADLPFDLREVGKALKILNQEEADFVSAFRVNRGADGLRRMAYSWFYNVMVNFLFKIKIRDINFSFKFFKREILNNIQIEAEGSFISAELLVKCILGGFKIAQFPVRYYPRTQGRSTLSSFSVILKIIQELFNFYFKFFMRGNGK